MHFPSAIHVGEDSTHVERNPDLFAVSERKAGRHDANDCVYLVLERDRSPYGVGRLKPEVTLEAANADLNTISRRLETQYPEANTGHTVVAVDMRSAMVGDLPLRALLSVSSAL